MTRKRIYLGGLGAAVLVTGWWLFGGALMAPLTAQQGETPQDPKARMERLAERAKADPRPDTWFELGHLRFVAGDPAAGFDALARAVALAPDGHYTRTYLAHQLDKLAFAPRLELIESLHQTLPDDPLLLERLGRLHQGKGANAKAEALFKRWVAVRPTSAEAQSRLAEFYRATGRLEPAAAALEKVRTLLGESTYALRRLGVIYREMGRLDDSAERLLEAIDQVETHDDQFALVELGHTRMAQKQPKDAVKRFQKAAKLDPASPAFQLFVAQARAAAKDVKGAEAAYRETLELDKFNLAAQLGLGQLFLDQKRYADALPHLREASSRNDRDPDLHLLVGETALKAGDLERARFEHNKLKQIRSTTRARQLLKQIKAYEEANP